MKKIFMTLTCLAILSTGTVFAHDGSEGNFPPPPPCKSKTQKPPVMKLDEKLNLTEEQQDLLKKNRIESRKKLKPIMQEIFDKKNAIADIRDSELSKDEQDKKIELLKNDLRTLKATADEIRKADMEYFESILTKDQKAKFEEIKKEMRPKQGHFKKPCKYQKNK